MPSGVYPRTDAYKASVSARRKGKTYDELYGQEAATAIRAKLSEKPRPDNVKIKISMSMKARLAQHGSSCECTMHRRPIHPDGCRCRYHRSDLYDSHPGAPKNCSCATHRSEHPNNCTCSRHSQDRISGLSWKLIDFLLRAGFEVIIPEQRFGVYSVDVYLPEYHLAFEADGDYWHNISGIHARDENRDAYLLRKFELPVIRLWEHEINELIKVVANEEANSSKSSLRM